MSTATCARVSLKQVESSLWFIPLVGLWIGVGGGGQQQHTNRNQGLCVQVTYELLRSRWCALWFQSKDQQQWKYEPRRRRRRSNGVTLHPLADALIFILMCLCVCSVFILLLLRRLNFRFVLFFFYERNNCNWGLCSLQTVFSLFCFTIVCIIIQPIY